MSNEGNILGAQASIDAAVQQPKSLKQFLTQVNYLGVQVTNNFEVTFSGLPNITFYVTSINFNGLDIKTEEVYYNGRSVPFPVMYDYNHDGSMTIINDGHGFYYAAFMDYLITHSKINKLDCGHKLIIRCLTGDQTLAISGRTICVKQGSMITFHSVFIKSIDGLSFQQSGGDVSTFNISFNYRDFIFTQGQFNNIVSQNEVTNSLIS